MFDLVIPIDPCDFFIDIFGDVYIVRRSSEWCSDRAFFIDEAETSQNLFHIFVQSFRLFAEDELFHSLDIDRDIFLFNLFNLLVDIVRESSDLVCTEIFFVVIQFIQEEDQAE